MRILRKGSQAHKQCPGTGFCLNRPDSAHKLAGIRTKARNEARAEGAMAELGVGCWSRAQNPGVTQAEMEDKLGASPSTPNAFPSIPIPVRTIQAYLFPELSLQAQSGGATATTAPRSGGGDSVSPRPAPGRRRREEGGARATPGNRPSASEGSPGWLRSRTRPPLARVKLDWHVGRKRTKREWKVRKGDENTTRPLGESTQNAAGSLLFALIPLSWGSFRPPD